MLRDVIKSNSRTSLTLHESIVPRTKARRIGSKLYLSLKVSVMKSRKDFRLGNSENS